MAKTIQAFLLRTDLIVDATKAHAEYQKAEKSVEKYGTTVTKVGKEAAKAFDGQAAGKKWGSEFGISAVAAITGGIQNIGQSIGALFGSAIAPGIGTVIGSTVGSGIDSLVSKVSARQAFFHRPLVHDISQQHGRPDVLSNPFRLKQVMIANP